MDSIDIVEENSLSVAWSKAFLNLYSRSANYYKPMIVSICDIGNIEPEEDEELKRVINNVLQSKGKRSISDTSTTIFPYKAWLHYDKPDCNEFSEWYLNKYLPRHQQRVRKTNHKIKNTYFERMVLFTGIRSREGKVEPYSINQLKYEPIAKVS